MTIEIMKVAQSTASLQPDSGLQEFRGPVCPQWEMWWRKIANNATIDRNGRLHMNDRIIGMIQTGCLYTDPAVYGVEEELGQRPILVKNHLDDFRFHSLVGVMNGLTVFFNYAFTVEVGEGNRYYLLRAVQESEQELMKNFFKRCLPTK